VNEAQHATLLCNTELARAVGGVRMLVHARCKLVLENLYNVTYDAWRDGDILMCPWNVFNNGDLNRREVLIAETPLLHFCPHQPEFIEFEDVV
jgi:hypothetical protein